MNMNVYNLITSMNLTTNPLNHHKKIVRLPSGVVEGWVGQENLDFRDPLGL